MDETIRQIIMAENTMITLFIKYLDILMVDHAAM